MPHRLAFTLLAVVPMILGGCEAPPSPLPSASGLAEVTVAVDGLPCSL